MVPGLDDLLPPSSNIHYPLRFTRQEGLLDNDETLPIPQWPVELKDGIQHQQNIRIMLQHDEPMARPFSPLNISKSIYGADHWLWDPCV